MEQILTYTTRLRCEAPEKLIAVLEAQRLAFDYCSQVRFEKGTKNSITELHSLVYYPFRESYPEIPAQVVIRAEQECLSTYRSIKSNKHKIDKPVEKKALSMRLDHNLYTYKGDGIFKFSTLEIYKTITAELELYPRLQELLDTYNFCDPELFVKDDEIWIALSFKIPVLKPKEELAIGVDLGIRMAAVTSEGKFYQDKEFNARKRKLRYLKRELQSKIDLDRNAKEAKRHLKKLRRKEAAMNRNQTHHLANRILQDTEADVIVLEDLSGLKKKKHKNQNKNKISQVPFYMLSQVISYKAPLLRKTVTMVDPSFTSQTDHRTGERDGEKRGRRYYGSDGVILDADHNAAVNIAAKTKHPISYNFVLDGQAAVSRPCAQKIGQASSLVVDRNPRYLV